MQANAPTPPRARRRLRAQTDRAPLRLALITPPLDASGGIGRLTGHVVADLASADVEITLLDPRGRSERPLLSILPLAQACARLLFLGARRRIDVAHVNIAARGSSVRKPVIVWTCRLARIPVVLHLHGGRYEEFFQRLPRPAKAFLRATFRRAHTVIVLGD